MSAFKNPLYDPQRLYGVNPCISMPCRAEHRTAIAYILLPYAMPSGNLPPLYGSIRSRIFHRA